MSGGFPQLEDICNAQSIGVDTAASSGTSVTSGASAHTKGAWTQLVAATPADCSLFEVSLLYDSSGNGGGSSTVVVDIAIGPSGSEVILFPDLILSVPWDNRASQRWLVPLQLPAGTRIAARAQATMVSAVIQVAVNTFEGAFSLPEGLSGVDAIGFNSGTTRYTAVAPGAANVKGAFSQLIASTARDYAGLFLGIDTLQSSTGPASMLIDIAIGGSGSEQVILPNLWYQYANTSQCLQSFGYYPLPIKAGTRISVRFQSSAGWSIGPAIYGVF